MPGLDFSQRKPSSSLGMMAPALSATMAAVLSPRAAATSRYNRRPRRRGSTSARASSSSRRNRCSHAGEWRKSLIQVPAMSATRSVRVVGLHLKRLELVKRLTACMADVYRLACGRAELALQLGVARAKPRTHGRGPSLRDLPEPPMLRRSWRRNAVAAQLLARLDADPIRCPRRRVNRLEVDLIDPLRRERRPDVLLDLAHRRASRIRRRDRDRNARPFHGDVAHDPELHHAYDRNLGILDRFEDRQHALAPEGARRRARHHFAPGSERATICISASMWPRNSEWRPLRPPVA